MVVDEPVTELVARLGARAARRGRARPPARPGGGVCRRSSAASPCAASRAGWRVYSRSDFAPVVEKFVLDGQQAKLTQASLETLAVIAYRQPVSRSRVSAVRGVNVDGVVRTLLIARSHRGGRATVGRAARCSTARRLLPPTHGAVVARRPPGPRALPARRRRHRRAHRGRTRMSEHSRSPRQPRKKGIRLVRRPGSARGGRARPPHAAAPGPRRRTGRPRRGRAAAVRRRPRPAGPRSPARPRRASRRGCPTATAAPEIDVHDPEGVRLQKLMAAGGVGSRRVCENLIEQGRVEVDGQIVTELGVRINPQTQVVHVDGVRVNLDEDRVYLAFNKPKGVVTTMHDELGRISLEDYVGNRERAALPRRPARRRHRGPAAAHERRRPRPPAPAPGIRRAQDLRRRDPRAGAARRRQAAARGRRARGRPGERRLVPDRRLTSPARRWSRWCSTRVASTSCAGCSRPSATRCSSLVRTQVGPIHLGDTKSGRMRRLNKAEIGALQGRWSVTGRPGWAARSLRCVVTTHVRIVGTGLIGTSLGIALSPQRVSPSSLDDPSPTAVAPGARPRCRARRRRRRPTPRRRRRRRAARRRRATSSSPRSPRGPTPSSRTSPRSRVACSTRAAARAPT